MNDNPLIFIVGGALFLFLGLNGLRKGEIYLGRLVRFIGPRMVLKSRIAVLIFGVGFSIGGVVSLLSGLGVLLSPQSDIVDQIMPIAFVALGVGFIGSIAVELFLYASSMPPYDDVDPQDVADQYSSRYR
ncbi:MAG: hypothetical protein F4X02_07220 [Chloroflexi bacterium]|nr:hypothetical protein [Chloroflexota bacterium]